MPGRCKTLLLVLLAGALACAAFAGPAPAAGTCDLYASPGGSGSGTGSLASPLGSVQQLDWALTPGQTGCLLSGTYGTLSTDHVLNNSGTASGQITITSAPGAIPKILGLVELQASYLTLSALTIDGSNNLYTGQRSGTNCPYPVSNGLEIDGHNDIFQDNDFYQSVASLRGNGIGIGWNHPADNTIIRDNRIHDLGQCMAYDQMIYLAHGNGVQIYDNWMWNDHHGWGVQVYPAATNAHIHDNVIDGAGSGFVIGGSSQVSGNTIDHNIIINSTGLPNAGLAQGVGISTCCGLGPGNSFTDNIVANNPGGITAASGITLSGNTTAAPSFADAAAHDYRLGAQLPGWNLWDGELGAYATPTATSPATTSSTSVATTTAGLAVTTSTTPATQAKPVSPPVTKAKSRNRRAASRARRRRLARMARATHKTAAAARRRGAVRRV